MGLVLGTFDNSGLVGKITQRRTPAIVQGEDWFCVVQVAWKGLDRPYAFSTPVGAASALFSPASGTDPIAVTGAFSTRPDQAGCILFSATAEQTAGILAAEQANVQVDFEDDLGFCTLLIENAVDVVEPYFPL